MIMNELGKLYELKPESVHEPDINLGANIEKVQLPDGNWTFLWAARRMSRMPSESLKC